MVPHATGSDLPDDVDLARFIWAIFALIYTVAGAASREHFFARLGNVMRCRSGTRDRSVRRQALRMVPISASNVRWNDVPPLRRIEIKPLRDDQ